MTRRRQRTSISWPSASSAPTTLTSAAARSSGGRSRLTPRCVQASSIENRAPSIYHEYVGQYVRERRPDAGGSAGRAGKVQGEGQGFGNKGGRPPLPRGPRLDKGAFSAQRSAHGEQRVQFLHAGEALAVPRRSVLGVAPGLVPHVKVHQRE